jgi:F-type H+-transporting ATPase subunit alpha
VSIFAGTRGFIDDVPVTDVKRFESELLEYVRGRHGGMLEQIRTGAVPDDLGDTITAFKEQFAASGGEAHAVDPLSVDADELGDAESQKTLATE